MTKKIPFSLNVPVSFSSVKLSFYITEFLRCTGYNAAAFPHNHVDFELKYVTNGEITQIISGEEHRLTAGDTIIIQPNRIHYATEDSITPNLAVYSIRISVKNPDEPGASELAALFKDAFRARDERFSLSPLFNKLCKEVNYRRPGYFNYVQAICLSILIEYLRLTGKDTSRIFTFDESKYTSYWYDRMDAFLHSRYMDNISLEDLAQNINLSPRHATRMVKRVYGVSFIAKLTEIRLDNAKYMLRHTKKGITDIALCCGFSSYCYFTSCFKKNIGITPGEYRANTKRKS